MELDSIDERILGHLRADGRMSNADLAAAVGLSPSACLRRVRALESRGVIRGYTAILDARRARQGIVVFVQISLERQTDDCLGRFEKAARRCPEIRECYLMTGVADYQLRLVVADMTEYERVHRDVLSALPGVARIQSSFTIRAVIQPMEG
ncbi:Lrp/AsnC family transcriptional regulator [Rhodovarius lipocyclicus]|jgi:DNA-binding Lrp family transcriptional regulator|uniref:Lrp/AsnC family transcriptional regulator n=1 Tax=Rhodovarius lipocyclicus TaxID=268410 RepID=UPI00135BE026|nr:Lrp/AsnC family transcriptional regulator [Rhodovarius lipocyclicus]